MSLADLPSGGSPATNWQRLGDDRPWEPVTARDVVLATTVVVLLANSVPIALLPVHQDELGLPLGAALAAAEAGRAGLRVR